MKSKLLMLMLALFLLTGSSVSGQGFSLEEVIGAVDASTLPADGATLVQFNIRLVSDTFVLTGMTNGFRIYSDDGAFWTTTVGDTLTSGWGGIGAYFDQFTIKDFSVTGSDADTLGFGGVKLFLGVGLPANYNEVAYSITVGPIAASEHGKTLCLDSAWFPPAGVWLWGGSGGLATIPSWSGPHCYNLDSCAGTLPDSDGDGLGDDCDPCPDDPQNDQDEDGFCYSDDNCPDLYNPEQTDTDGDGTGDECDDCTDSDNDGLGNPGFPQNNCPDDNCPDNYNPLQTDSDGDGIGDECDTCTDLDGDGFGDPGFIANTCQTDNCPDIYNPDQTDSDGDGKGDDCDDCYDTDEDNYGNPGHPENECPDDNCPEIRNPLQRDSDGDGAGDACDSCTDTDGDGFGDPGFPANRCLEDNCPDIYNPLQEDADGDGKGDACDAQDIFISSDIICGDIPLDVQFFLVNDSGQNISGLLPIWDFGDGNTTFNTEFPIHTYNDVGIFDISVVIYLENKIDTLYFDKMITTKTDLNADFVAIPTLGREPLTVTFDPVLDNIATDYLWYFGDGDSSFAYNPIHTYESPGQYDVTFMVGLNSGECAVADTVTKTNYVRVTDLKANFTGSPTVGIAPLVVNFSDISEGNPVTWEWDFSDGPKAYTPTHSHSFNDTGFYDISLKVSNSSGIVDSIFLPDYIKVYNMEFINLAGDISATPVEPGFDMNYKFYFGNNGSIPSENCSLLIVLPTELTFVELTPGTMSTGDYVNYGLDGNTITIPMGTIEPTSWPGGYFNVKCSVPTSLLPDDTITATLNVVPTDDDINVVDNFITSNLPVTGTFMDLNKFAFPGGDTIYYEIEDFSRLNYTILIENKPTTSDSINVVRVFDTLSPNLEWSSLTIDSISHPDKCGWYFDGSGGVLYFYCDSLMLPPNLPKPTGELFFSYSVSPPAVFYDDILVENKAYVRIDNGTYQPVPMNDDKVTRLIKFLGCCIGRRGNVDFDSGDAVDISDIVYYIDYMLATPSGPAPPCFEEADLDVSGELDISDIVYLINYMLVVPSGPAPPMCR